MKLKKGTLLFLLLTCLAYTALAQEVGYELKNTDVDIDDNGKITNYKSSNTNIIIPVQIGDITITGIGDNAFNDKSLVAVVFEEGSEVTTIGASAFQNNQITALTLPTTLASIGADAFSGNTGLTITLPEHAKGADVTYKDSNDQEYDPNDENKNTFTNFDRSLAIEIPPFYTLKAGDVTVVDGIITECHCEKFVSKRITIPEKIGETTIEGIDGKWPGIFQEKNLVSVKFADNSKVTTIGNAAFRDNPIVTLTLPATLTTIGDNAFWTNLITELILPASLKTIGKWAFRDNKITELSLPTALTTISEQAFYGNKITELTLPASLTTIGITAFRNNQITELTFPEDSQLASIGDDAFTANQITELTLPISLTTIGERAFSSNQITELTFPENSQLASIGANAFSGNTGLTGITLPEHAEGAGVTYKDSNDQEYNQGDTFTNFERSLVMLYTLQEGDVTVDDQGIITACTCTFDSKRIIIPEKIGTKTITGIGDNWPGVFQGKNLVSVAFASDSEVTTIGSAAFNDNPITELTLPATLTTIGDNAFRDNQITELTLPESLTTIGKHAFRENPITELTLPATLETIGEYAFRYNKITRLTIPENSQLTTIGSYAFSDNEITTLTLPATLETIGEYAFQNNSLTDVAFDDDPNKSQIKSIGSNAFSGNTAKLNDDGIILPQHAGGDGVTYKDSNDQVYNPGQVFKNFERSLVAVFLAYELEKGDVTADGGIITKCVCENFVSNNIIIPVQIEAQVTTGTGDYVLQDITGIGPNAFEEKNLVAVAFADGSQITSIGNGAFRNNQIGILTLPTTVTTIEASAFKGNNITKLTFPDDSQLATIGSYAFFQNKITELTLPTTVTTIGNYAFNDNQITELTLPTSLETIGEWAFKDNQITELILPTTLTTIGNYAFERNSLTSVTFAGNENDKSMIRSIGINAFKDNSALTTITLPLNGNNNFDGYRDSNGGKHDEAAQITNFALEYKAFIPYTLTADDIDVNSDGIITQCDCNNLTSSDISIPASITKDGNVMDIVGIGLNIFFDEEFTSVLLPEGLISIGVSAFTGGNYLTTLIIPSSVKYIGANAFYRNNLTAVTFAGDEANIISIGHAAFAENTGLTSIDLPSHVQGDDNFRYKDSDGNEYAEGAKFNDFSLGLYVDIPYTLTADDIEVDADGVITKCNCDKFDSRTITIPTTITKLGSDVTITGIGDDVFANKYLATLSFSDNSEVTTIGNGAFRHNQITELSLPTTLTTIGEQAFRLNQITEFTLPTTLTTIGGGAFSGNQITELTFPEDSQLTTIGEQAFRQNQITELTFPEDSQLTTIGEQAFRLNQITELTLPTTLTTIGERAFDNNPSLESFILPSVTIEGFRTYWQDGNSEDLGDNLTINQANFGKSFERISIEQFTLTTAVAEQQGGTISANPTPYQDNKYDINTKVTLTATSNEGWRFDKWVITGGENGNDNPTIVTVDVVVTVDADKTATAHFVEAVTLTLTIEETGDSNVVSGLSAGENKIDKGADFKLKAMPASGQRFVSWTIDGKTITNEEYTLPATTTETNISIKVIFEAIPLEEQVTLTLNIVGEGSTTPDKGESIYEKDYSVELTAKPNEGWRFDKWVISDEQDKTDNPTIVTVDVNKTVTAHFVEAVILTLTIVETEASGEVNGLNAGKNKIDKGADFKLKAMPASGQRFVSWTINGKTITNEEYTLPATTTETDISIKVIFEAIPQQVTLTLAIEGEGSINPLVKPNLVDPDNEMKGMYDINTEIELTAKPNDGWKFDKWEISDEEDKTDETTTITLDKNKSVTAHFVKEEEEEEAITSILTEVVNSTPYPNPVTSQITLKAKDGDLIQLFSQKGKQQYSAQHTGNEVHTIDVSTMPVGVYLVRITDAEGNTTTKRILKK